AQSREQARDADREAGRGHWLLAEARDQAVIAPTAADRPEADRPAVVARRFEGQLRLEDGAGVIFEPAHDGGVDADAVPRIAGRFNKNLNLHELGVTISEQRTYVRNRPPVG